MKGIKINKDHFYLFLILILAIILRFYNAFEIPYTYDEFSALFRTDFESFSDLINRGVAIDAHPAGVQVFLYYWILLFGSSEFIVKLPFLLMGVGSVYLIYKLALVYYNSSTALLSALFMAALAYPLMYSQIARPYILGLFLTLWMVLHWSIYLFKTTTKFNKHLLIYVLASALAAYNHHFSLLFAAIVGVSGLFFISKERFLYYALSGLTIFILYIPHLNIFFQQLSYGGVGGSNGWLGAPKGDFLWQYIFYIFNFSWLIVGMVFGIMLLAWRFRKKDLERKRKFFYLSFSWFLAPFIIAYFYSIKVNPVLQYSVLIFSFPYLFFILFGHVPPLNDTWKVGALAILTPILLYSLVLDRKYYSLFYHSVYKESIEEAHDFQLREGNALSILDLEVKRTQYYVNQYPDTFLFYYLNDFKNYNDLISFLSASKAQKCAIATESSTDPKFFEMINDFYPVLTKKLDYYLGSYYEFSREGGQNIEIYRKRMDLDFEAEKQDWKFNRKNIVVRDSLTDNKAFQFKEGQEWGLSFEIPFDSLYTHENDLIDIRLDILSVSPQDELVMVSEIYSAKQKYDWRASSSLDFYTENDTSAYRLFHSLKLSDLTLGKETKMIKIYLWNKGKTAILVDNFDIRLRKGNPILYGLLKEIKE